VVEICWAKDLCMCMYDVFMLMNIFIDVPHLSLFVYVLTDTQPRPFNIQHFMQCRRCPSLRILVTTLVSGL
jgi:hypothetical protein